MQSFLLAFKDLLLNVEPCCLCADDVHRYEAEKLQLEAAGKPT
jgi:hypothetical protein